MNRRLTSRKVVLTAAFLALAAGGTAACDASGTDDYHDADGYSSDSDQYAGSDAHPVNPDEEYVEGEGVYDEESVEVESVDEESVDQVFYCADEDGEIVAEARCAGDGSSTYFLWHSAGYPRGLRPGTILDGGDFIRSNDRQARRALQLPATGRVANGTVKTNVVGSGSPDSAGRISAGG